MTLSKTPRDIDIQLLQFLEQSMNVQRMFVEELGTAKMYRLVNGIRVPGVVN